MYKHNATFYTIVLSVSSDANFIHTLFTDIHIGRIWNMAGKALVANCDQVSQFDFFFPYERNEF